MFLAEGCHHPLQPGGSGSQLDQTRRAEPWQRATQQHHPTPSILQQIHQEQVEGKKRDTFSKTLPKEVADVLHSLLSRNLNFVLVFVFEVPLLELKEYKHERSIFYYLYFKTIFVGDF